MRLSSMSMTSSTFKFGLGIALIAMLCAGVLVNLIPAVEHSQAIEGTLGIVAGIAAIVWRTIRAH